MDTFNTMKKKYEKEYGKWIDHLNNTKDRTNYSIRRMDLLMISISGAGIYIIFETIRQLKTNPTFKVDNESLLIWSGIAFLLCIICNFISQITGYHGNNNEEKYTQIQLKKIEGKKVDSSEQIQYDNKVNRFNFATDVLNVISITLMFAGLIVLTVFNYLLL